MSAAASAISTPASASISLSSATRRASATIARALNGKALSSASSPPSLSSAVRRPPPPPPSFRRLRLSVGAACLPPSPSSPVYAAASLVASTTSSSFRPFSMSEMEGAAAASPTAPVRSGEEGGAAG
eukprot:CAMPEP_0183327298 /NCGR_PEP_ID=MMETSP0160_2-20130417/83691_1 /TAXON_ID=2839 ORGANISM="Odontella Sinensis, Strain Grunow 1884" /NCGR_SAMPLE_ID=MMETSP0160_2 /ASSEMBLY_ACC=CAM_ASM_000250 /LENGTH=126 /DNA_ID=CAMNT_0025495423 /DNA_START=509 /DNA_END=886 /DNA_ORIENTATION=-